MNIPRMLWFTAFFFLTFILTQTASAQAANNPCGDQYVVEKGDWLSTIASRCGVSVADLLSANPDIRNPERIYTGQVILIPGAPPKQPAVQILEEFGQPGGVLTVRLTGFPPETEVELGLGRQGEYLVSAGKHQTSSNGSLQVKIEIPKTAIEGEAWIAGAVVRSNSQVAAVSQTVSVREGPITYTVRRGDRLSLIASRHGTSLAALLDLNPEIGSPNLIFVGQQLVIPPAGYVASQEAQDKARGLAAPAPGSPTITVDPGERWIDVDLARQAVYAYEGDEVVRSFVVSTGKPATPTVTGQYKIYVKLEATNMRGPGYYYRDVPYTMYFYRGYGLHGTFWHSNFGTPMSAGCVNLSIEDARWLFDFASVGTLVNVH